MYRLVLTSTYASIFKDGQPIGALSGLYMASAEDITDLEEIVRLANLGLEQEKGD